MLRAPAPLVKICGMTRVADVRAAVAAGADAIGLVFAAESRRRVTPAAAARLVRWLPSSVAAVGVFVNEPQDRMAATARRCRLSWLQLHGEETPADCRRARQRTGLRIIKAIRIGAAADVSTVAAYRGAVDAILLDAAVAGARGGTGRSFDWRWVTGAKRVEIPTILSGGLKPETVARAVRLVRPAGVDVSSGVERRPGLKDPVKVAAFIRAARQA